MKTTQQVGLGLVVGSLLAFCTLVLFQNCGRAPNSLISSVRGVASVVASSSDGESSKMSTTSANEPCIPLRGPSVNEGFTGLDGYSLGQSTTQTVSKIAKRLFTNQAPGAVKIWPIKQTLSSGELDPVFVNTKIKVVVFRPYANQVVLPSRPAQQSTACGRTGFHASDVDTDYGVVAETLYSRFGDLDKTVILTGWESDNQLFYWPPENPGCAGWPVNPADVDSYRQLLQQRQNGVMEARLRHPDARLKVYHAVEVKQVPEKLHPGHPHNTVLEKIVPKMNPKPDFISYSAWGAKAANIKGKLDIIATASGLPNSRIFVGEWGCDIGAPGSLKAKKRAGCFSNHTKEVFEWGARLWFAWTYAGHGGYDTPDLIDRETGLETPNGLSEISKINSKWHKTFACPR